MTEVCSICGRGGPLDADFVGEDGHPFGAPCHQACFDAVTTASLRGNTRADVAEVADRLKAEGWTGPSEAN